MSAHREGWLYPETRWTPSTVENPTRDPQWPQAQFEQINEQIKRIDAQLLNLAERLDARDTINIALFAPKERGDDA